MMADSRLLYLEPTSAAEAAALLKEHGAAASLLAGGTAIVLLMQQKLIQPGVLISLDRVDGLRGIAVDSQGVLHIGAMARLREAAQDGQICRDWPLLAQACQAVGNVRMRNQATLGGNIVEADYASDPPTALTALEAFVNITGPGGERRVDIKDLFLGFSNVALGEDEILTEICVPPLPNGSVSRYVKFKSRSEIDRPCVGLAVILQEEKGCCKFIKIAIGAVSGAPQRFYSIERQCIGQEFSPAAIRSLADAYAQALENPLDDLRGSGWYRREIVRVLVNRTLTSLRELEKTK